MMYITDHCIARVIRRTGCPFNYDEVREQIAILVFAVGGSGEHIPTCDGTIIIEDGVAVTFLEPGMRPKKNPKRKG
jgi:hypothetical protein